MSHRVFILVPAAAQPAANAAAAQFDPEGGLQTFRRPVNPSGSTEDPATHFVASAQVRPETFLALPALAQELGGQFWEYDLENDSGFPTAKLAELGLAFAQDPQPDPQP